jgi:hypothetical protein
MPGARIPIVDNCLFFLESTIFRDKELFLNTCYIVSEVILALYSALEPGQHDPGEGNGSYSHPCYRVVWGSDSSWYLVACLLPTKNL